jgi:hypothetical protein
MNDDEVDFNVEIAIWSPFIGKYLLTFGNIERVVRKRSTNPRLARRI